MLWRLLAPEAFGLMAIVNVFLQGLHMFSDVGIGPSIIQNKRGDEPDYLNTAWSIQAARGLLLFLAAALTAVPLSKFYGEPALAHLIPVVAFSSVIDGFKSTRLITSTRHIALGRLTVIELSSQGLGVIAMISLALWQRSIWALVVGSLVQATVRLTLSHNVLPGVKNRLRWDRSSAVVLLKFGRWIFLSTLLSFAVEQSDRLIFGKLVPMSLLGIYSIALMWATIPTQVSTNLFSSVLFPALSRVHNADGDMPEAFLEFALPWLYFAGYLSSCLLSGGPLLVRFLYDQRALPAGTFMQILAVGTWFGVLASANATTLFARGVPKYVVLASAGKLLGMIAFIPLGLHFWGFQGAIGGFVAAEFIAYGALIAAATRLKLKRYNTDIRLSLFVAVATLVGWLTARMAESSFSSLNPKLGAFLAGALVFVAQSAGWGYLFWTRVRARQQRVALSQA